MNKYLYHRNNLYNIIKETANNYNLERFNKVSFEKYMTPINFKTELADNYHVFAKYDRKGIVKNNILFNKTQRDYIIIDKFNVIDSILIIINNNNILTSKVIINNDIEKYKFYYNMKHITDNIRIVVNRQFQRNLATMYGYDLPPGDIDAVYHNAKLNLVQEFADIVGKIETQPNKQDIHTFLDSTDANINIILCHVNMYSQI